MTTPHLTKSKVIYEAGDTTRYAYFPNNGMASMLCMTKEGDTLEVAMIGNEGMIGIPAILRVGVTPYRVIVQLPADAMKIRADILRDEFNRGGKLQDVILRYMHALMMQMAQSAVCNQLHSVEERLCRWLLTTHDRANTNTFELTHEFISHMLGAPRTGVSMAAGALQQAELIRYSRGRIAIRDRKGLEAESCECYQLIKEGLDQFLIT